MESVLEIVDDCLKTATSAADSAARQTAAASIASAFATVPASAAFAATHIVEALRHAMANKSKTGAAAREGACQIVSALAAELKASAEPFLVQLLEPLFEMLGDKIKSVAIAAQAALDSVMTMLNPNAVKLVMPTLLAQNDKWQANEARLKYIIALTKTAKEPMSKLLGTMIPSVAHEMHDLKEQVSAAAKEALLSLCSCCSNTDVEPFIPGLMTAMEFPEQSSEMVYKLASTVFVQTVDGASLSVISPVLVRGFAERATATKRACARIVENMAKLVEDPRDITPFLPKLLPLLESAKESVSDPECRGVCDKAYEILKKKGDTSKVHQGFVVADMLNFFNLALGDATTVHDFDKVLAYLAEICITLNDCNNFKPEAWAANIVPYVLPMVGNDKAKAEEAAATVLAEVVKDHKAIEHEEVTDDAEELCNCNFSLAYGNKILLNNTQLKLKRGYRYGLMGKNDSGKTSLMRAIANGKIDGFPPASQLRTVFVETDIQGELSDLSVLDYMFADEILKAENIPKEEMAKTLQSVGFHDSSPANITTTVGALSGGWKMKLALARAMLLKADILLLDEPTNHLDAYNVKWVETYLMSLVDVTCIMVSHDSHMLDRVCTHIIHIEDLKLSVYKGNLSHFVSLHPEAKAYFELVTEKFTFRFPKPGQLPGITSKGKAIMKMSNITFTYPGAPKPQLNNVSIQLSLSSRVACVGVNGAGKSTMIKLLTGELEPDVGSGEVWKHPNCRVAYVAQHAFRHIENHLDVSANEYIRWRYQNGNDREGLEKTTRIVTEEDEKRMREPIMSEFVDAEGNMKKEKAVVKRLTEGRRQLRKEVEYEVEFVGKTGQYWVLQSKLEAGGWEKMLKFVDDAIAMRATQYARPLNAVNVEKHLEDVGLDPEFGTHMRIGALSGGQKVKVVLAAALWNCPHMLILDEPTNYLDRDSLAALAGAIREYDGGVVMITHNNQFCSSLCPETWHLENHTLNVKGDAEWMKNAMAQKVEVQAVDEMVDAFGNSVKLKTAKKELSRAEQRDKERKKKLLAKQGIKMVDSDEDD
jgi:elongation factor 3